jgi:predicted phage terminase large subunit-like protein
MKATIATNKKQAIREVLKLELARRDFWAFCELYDLDFFSGRPFLKDVASALHSIENGDIKSLSISLPPRAGKSYITTLFCAWTLGRNPTRSVMRNTCTATLYQKFSYDVRAIVKSDIFKKVFRGIAISDDKANLNGWNLNKSKQVGYFGAGVGGTIIGFGANNLAITDDLYRGIEDALSDTINDRVIQWKEATHDSRLETGAKVIDIGTRWATTDVIGRNMNNGRYDRSIVIPALDDKGRSFCEDVATTEDYLTKQKYTAPEIWEAEYMQRPVDMKGRLFNDLAFIDPSELKELLEANKDDTKPKGIEGAIAYVDVADQGNDYTALAIAVLIKGGLYVVDYVFTKENTDVTLPLIAGKLNYWGVSYCRVESNNMGAMFGRQLQRLVDRTKVLLVTNSTNKNTRIIMASAQIMQKFNFVKNDDQQSVQFIANVLSYSKEGKNKNDDAPDCLAGLSILCTSILKI